ncbi:DNA-binding protein [Stenotrophomonas acidaminiphila]
MARGITESDVHTAADAVVANGERPTVERIRAHLGTGSPNTVVRWLETWWQSLGTRLAQHDQVQVAKANVPEAVAALAGQWWTLALDHASGHAYEALQGERAALLDAQHAVERDRRSMEVEVTGLRDQAERALQAHAVAAARTVELERLVEHLQRQLDELAHQRNASVVRITEAEGAREALQVQIQQLQQSSRTERETLAQHVRTTEDRAHAEVDRARQESKDAQQQLASLQKDAVRAKHDHQLAIDRVQADAASLRQELTIQQARADALEAQLSKLQDLPAALEAVWRQRAEQEQTKTSKPVRAGRRRGRTTDAPLKDTL